MGPIASGESWGRTTNGNGRFAPLAQATLGQQNSLPRVGSIVISEIQFHPSEPSSEALQIEAGLDARDLEFLEIHNPTADNQDLTLWQIRGGVEWDFAPGAVIESDQSLVVTSFDPDSSENANRLAAFRQHYALEADVSLVGGYSGNLSNSGEIVQLLRPVDPLDGGQTTVYHVLEEETIYDDRDPWPTEADGAGNALTRTRAGAFSNSPTSWTAEVPSPGIADLVFAGDMDLDGDVDFDDIDDLVTAINDADAYQQRFGASALLNGDINKSTTQTLPNLWRRCSSGGCRSVGTWAVVSHTIRDADRTRKDVHRFGIGIRLGDPSQPVALKLGTVSVFVDSRGNRASPKPGVAAHDAGRTPPQLNTPTF